MFKAEVTMFRKNNNGFNLMNIPEHVRKDIARDCRMLCNVNGELFNEKIDRCAMVKFYFTETHLLENSKSYVNNKFYGAQSVIDGCKHKEFFLYHTFPLLLLNKAKYEGYIILPLEILITTDHSQASKTISLNVKCEKFDTIYYE